MKNYKDEIEKNAMKVGETIKNTAMNLKDDAQGLMANLENKAEDMMHDYESMKFSKQIKKQMKKNNK